MILEKRSRGELEKFSQRFLKVQAVLSTVDLTVREKWHVTKWIFSDNMNFEPSWAFDKMAFDFPMDPFGTLEVEGGFKGENLFGKCEGKC